MNEHPNAARMRTLPDLVAAGDMKQFLDAFSPDCSWRSDLGSFHGRDGIAAFFDRMATTTGGRFRPECEAVLGSEDHVVMFLRLRGETVAGAQETRLAHFATVDADGRFARNWFLHSDTEAAKRILG